MLEEIVRFIGRSSGLKVKDYVSFFEITQLVDGKKLTIDVGSLEAVLHRQDQDGKAFLQINLHQSKKILVTDHLVGFKPKPINGLDLKKLPRVVTTPDLLSVLEAIEETLGSHDSGSKDAEMLKKAYFAIISGAEIIGFRMDQERAWLARLVAPTQVSFS
ncbi:MAG: hypothetical protein RJB66_561 [Pseudomonadota bacterium]|jgi:hypothetical protein